MNALPRSPRLRCSPVSIGSAKAQGEAKMQWGTALEGWRKWMVAAGRPKSTLDLRTYQMRRFAEDNPSPWEQTTDTIIDWLVLQDWSTETRRSYRAALRSFYRWAMARGMVELDPASMLPPIKAGDRRPRPTPEGILAEALRTADPRTRLMIILAARHGLRRAEIAQVHSRDLAGGRGGWSLRVHGKGNKERVIPIGDEAAQLLRDRPAGWVFPGQIDGHLSPRWVGDLVQRHLPAGWTTHTLRHRFATVAYRGSRDLLAIQELLGHSKPETTRLYVELPDDSLRAAMLFAA